jgi:hypothetical protein
MEFSTLLFHQRFSIFMILIVNKADLMSYKNKTFWIQDSLNILVLQFFFRIHKFVIKYNIGGYLMYFHGLEEFIF